MRIRADHAHGFVPGRSIVTNARLHVGRQWVVTLDINVNGSSILSTELTIDEGELTSATVTTAVVISTSELSDDDQITVDVDTAGASAAGAKIMLIGNQPL